MWLNASVGALHQHTIDNLSPLPTSISSPLPPPCSQLRRLFPCHTGAPTAIYGVAATQSLGQLVHVIPNSSFSSVSGGRSFCSITKQLTVVDAAWGVRGRGMGSVVVMVERERERERIGGGGRRMMVFGGLHTK